MDIFSKRTPEQQAEEDARKERERREAQERKEAVAREAQEQQEAAAREKVREAFLKTPAGEARSAFGNGDHLFQYSIDVMNQQAIVHTLASLAPTGAKTKVRTNDPTAVLTSVCDEGWELVNGAFVFAEEGTTSRKQPMSSKVQEAVKGTVIGYYLFRRCEANRRANTTV